MPATSGAKTANATNRGTDSNAFINDYLADWDDDDPFRSPSPQPAKKGDKKEKPKQKTDVLGIEQELNLKKKPRAPRVKLDETRLLSEKGIPKLRKMAPRLKFKGKGHEFSDAARLLSFYQEWLDDLFPKATFLDALAMVEKTGHKTTMRNARLRWIDESRPKTTAGSEFDEADESLPAREPSSAAPARQPDRVAPIFERQAAPGRDPERERAKTPTADDLFGDDDIYDATPRATARTTGPSRQVVDEVPDGDELDALMAEAESGAGAQIEDIYDATPRPGARAPEPSRHVASEVPDGDELDALMAEGEAESGSSSAPFRSIFGDGSRSKATKPTDEPDEDELDALMAEAEAAAQASQGRKGNEGGSTSAQPGGQGTAPDDEDDLDALMAEAEMLDKDREYEWLKESEVMDELKVDAEEHARFRAEEDAMVEMDGF